MCGILGVYSRDGSDLSVDILNAMAMEIKHRGPDDQGIDKISENIGFAHRRLSILDLSSAGHQPMRSPCGRVVLAYNGEVYNFVEVRKTLEDLGVQFKSHSDTEVLLMGYMQWGIEVLSRLNGMFAFSLWDSRTETLYLVRDRLGVKPLYFSYVPEFGRLIFASEIKSILKHPSIKKEINPESIEHYLRLGFLTSGKTMFKGIEKIGPGQMLVLSRNDCNVRQWWDVPEVDYTIRKQESLFGELKNLFGNAVERRLRSDVPLGVLLSGGIDSTLVSTLATKYLDEPLKTFSSAFDVGKRSFKYNADADIAEQTARLLGTDHHRFLISFDKDIAETIKEAMFYFDEPNFVATNVTQLLITRYIKEKGITVLLDGAGGDELFGGYNRYFADKKISLLRKFPRSIRSLAKTSVKHLIPNKKSFFNALEKADLPDFSPERLSTWWGIFDRKEVENLLNSSFLASKDPLWETVNFHMGARKFTSNQDALLYMDLKMWLAECQNMSNDKMSMANSIEIRSPFLDYELTEFAFRIPFDVKTEGNMGKSLLRNCYRQEIPDFVWNRPKTGWFSPYFYWIRDFVFDDIKRKLEMISELPYFKSDVKNFMNDYPNVDSQQIWSLYSFACWYDAYFN